MAAVPKQLNSFWTASSLSPPPPWYNSLCGGFGLDMLQRLKHSNLLANHGGAIFKAYVQACLARAAKEVAVGDEVGLSFSMHFNSQIDGDTDPDHVVHKDQLQGVAIIAREVALSAITFLTASLNDISAQLTQALSANAAPASTWIRAPSNGAGLSTLYEQLHWLLLVAGNVIADSDDGEIPSPPYRYVVMVLVCLCGMF